MTDHISTDVEFKQVHYWRLMNRGSEYSVAHWQCYKCGTDLYGDHIFNVASTCPGKDTDE